MSEEKRKLCIEEVIGGGGNWALIYQHGNWGLNHVLMMIPTTELDPDCQESLVNNSCTSVLWGLQEEAQAIYQWLAKHSNTPFIVAGEYLVDCAQKMESIFATYGNDWDKFRADCKLYEQWRTVVHYVDNDDSGVEDVLYRDGWESLIDKANKWVEKEYH